MKQQRHTIDQIVTVGTIQLAMLYFLWETDYLELHQQWTADALGLGINSP